MEYKPEQLNYFRICYIAFNLVPEGLRDVFKQEWDLRYKTTTFGEWKDAPQNGRDFYNNETCCKKNARYLATIQNGKTAEWDCSCLFFAILYSDSIGTTLSPAVNNDVDELRQVRNEVAHISEAELTDAEFQNHVSNVLAAFNSLNLSAIAAEIEAIRKQITFPTAEVTRLKIQADSLKADLVQAKADLQTKEEELQKKEEEVDSLTQEINSKVESFCNLTFKPSHKIIRRSTDVKRIVKKMEDLVNGSNGAVSTIYLSGNPGCGKSQIARQIGQEVFNKRSQENTGLTFVATLNAETLETLADSYIGLGRKLGITEYTSTSLATSKVSSPKETIHHMTRLIVHQIKQFSNWLIIADNVVDLSLVRSDLPPTGSEEWGHGQVLITTQDGNSIPSSAPHTYHEPLSQGMQPDDAVQLLQQVSQIANEEQAEKVAEVLDYQPLALATAAFYAQTVVSNGSPRFSWTSYLKTLRSEERKATEEAFAGQNSAYSKTMTSAIKMAITRAAASDEVLRQAFCLFALCAPDSLPTEAAVNFVKSRATSETSELIKATILKSPLISCLYSEEGEPAYLRVHKVVYEVCKTTFTCDFENVDGAECIAVAIKTFHSLIEAEREQLLSSEHVCIKFRRITDHCREIHQRLTTSLKLKDHEVNEISPLITPEDVVSWLCSIADVCCDLSSVSNASVFSSSTLEFVKYIKSTKKGDLLKARAFSVHGDVSRLHCEYELALSYYEQAETIRVTVYGRQTHGEVASIYNKLGNVYSDLGQHSEAKEYHEKALSIRRKIYGEQHGDVATSYGDLGTVYRAVGQYSQAKKHYEKALNIRRNIHGEQHGDVAASYSNLGIVCRNLGQFSQAKEHHEKALTIRRKIYSEQHGNVAASYNNLGIVCSCVGQYSQAKEHHEKALLIRRKIYGEQHGHVAPSYNNLGIVYSDLGEYSQAKENHEKALFIRRKIYGEQHGNVAASYINLGTVYSYLGQHTQAKEHYENALHILRNIYGEQYGDVAATYNNLGIVYSELGQFSEAKEHLEKALNIRRKIYGEQHGAVATSYDNLGANYLDLEQYAAAKECFDKAMNIYKTIYDEQHPDVERCYRNLRIVERNFTQHEQSGNECCIL